MDGAWRMVAVAGVGLALAGCSVSGLAPLGPAPTPVVAAAPPPVVYGTFLDGPVGRKLSTGDRDKALAAQEAALASGQRKTWRGDSGVYGFVEPAAGGPAPVPAADGTPPPVGAAADTCRDFTSTIYVGGRPQVGHGRGCQNPDGSFRVVG